MSTTAHIIVIEDDDANRRSYQRFLKREGYDVSAFEDAESALKHLGDHPTTSLIVTDLMLPGADGFGVLDQARRVAPGVGVLMITGHGTIESAVDAMKKGADDYLQKPVNLEELRTRVAGIVEKRRLRAKVDELEKKLGEKFGKLIGKSKAMEALFRQLDLVAPTRSNVLIIGDSGTGKELVANALHEHSPRRDKRFLPINCAAIPAEILESELFGHERGAFTGATGRKVGMFELAHKGTLFLDEIGELPQDMQAKLLRVLEQRELMRVGGSETIKIDIRLVAATNQDLEAAVEAGRFRSDLYYRLKVVTVKIPTLRDRREDIPILVSHFLDLYAKENDREGLRLSPEALRVLVEARWEGNVRELRNVVESLVVLTPGDEIGVEDIPEEYRVSSAGLPPAQAESAGGAPTGGGATAGGATTAAPLTMDAIERQAILQALETTGGNRTQAAEMLGIGLRTLQRKLKEYRMAGQVEEG
ncbi:sigma-54 dependent transcriptional regulator [bacterium]|nr:sigma-54 dependent transcriptional regulator [bacterium]